MVDKQNPELREFILRNVEENPATIAAIAGGKFGVSRAGVARYMRRLIHDRLLTATGATKGRQYKLAVIEREDWHLESNGLWNENTVWENYLAPLMEKNLKPNVVKLFQHGVTEMINNVIDHSGSPELMVIYTRTHVSAQVIVSDTGVGIFNKIKSDFRLEDARTALLELSKGRLTSDKKHHAGEGIYFTSRMFNRFSIASGHLGYGRVRRDGDDWLIEATDAVNARKGTLVGLEIRTDADWTVSDVFDTYMGENPKHRTTHVPLSLGRYPGEELVSRSQAKRILARVDTFDKAELDFEGVEQIGQGFADEIFRVFANAHPKTTIVPMNANKRIERMIAFVKNNAGDASPTTDGEAK